MLKKIVCVAVLASAAFALSAFEEAVREFSLNNDYEKALSLFESSCYEDKNAAGCYAAGFINTYGYSGEADSAKGGERFLKACEMGDMDGCKSVGDSYEVSQNGREADYEKALKYHEKACGGEVGAACTSAARYYDGRGKKTDHAKAFKFYEKGCGYEDASGCGALADMYEHGEGTQKNETKAREFYGLACDYGLVDSCADFRRLYKMKK